jgi:hypothetical protein
MAGEEGFEPPNARTKTWCLTTWPLPTNFEGQPTVFLQRRFRDTRIPTSWNRGYYLSLFTVKEKREIIYPFEDYSRC